ncbi:hypothetical protein [Actinoplanes sp. NPDC051411]|uniref:hypothetical protein n=1 Tax=Actinoplanes sp. NPDC051411 TaxID=3155522 RepID=UPI00342ED380
MHTGSDLKVFLTWCTGQALDPLNLGRAEIERYVRWLQETRCYQPSTVPGGCRSWSACVIDQLLAHSPADYVSRPNRFDGRQVRSHVSTASHVINARLIHTLERAGSKFHIPGSAGYPA